MKKKQTLPQPPPRRPEKNLCVPATDDATGAAGEAALLRRIATVEREVSSLRRLLESRQIALMKSLREIETLRKLVEKGDHGDPADPKPELDA